MAPKARPSRNKPRKSYVADPFEVAGIKDAIYASSDSGSSEAEAPDDASDPEVPPEELEEAEEEDEFVIEDERNPSDEDDGAVEGVEPDDEEAVPLGIDFVEEEGMSDESGAPRIRVPKPKGDKDVPRRFKGMGIEPWDLRGGKEMRCAFLFGPTKNDMEPVIRTRDKWEQHVVLPIKGDIGCARSYFAKPGDLEAEKKRIREWYWDSGGKDAFTNGQKTKTLTEAAGQAYLPKGNELRLFMGPITFQQLYTLKPGEFMSTAEPFENKEDRPGWLLNLGDRIADAQWAMNEEGTTQYLAVVVEQRKPGFGPHTLHTRSPAFAPMKGYPASIQIWAFDPAENTDVDTKSPPRLELVICTEWGAAKHIRWSPVATSDAVEDEKHPDQIHLGLLAGVWMDGKVRILDIWYPKPSPNTPQETHYIHYTRSAFEAQAPNTVFTCLTWLSPASLAVGTGNGCIAIWTLTRRETFPLPGFSTTQTPRYEAVPWFYKMLAASYVLTLCSAYPSHPSYLSVTSVDGYSRLVDLRDTNLDSIRPSRTRIFGNTQIWHEHTQSFMTPDENYMMRNHTLRRYYMNIHSFAVESTIMACAASMVHPVVLLGSAAGHVNTGNPIGRMLDVKEVPWQQVWFAHEWRRGKRERDSDDPTAGGGDEDVDADAEGEPDDDDNTANLSNLEINNDPPPPSPDVSDDDEDPNAIPQHILDGPLCRMTEGFKPRGVSLMRYRSPNDKGLKIDAGAARLALFEEKTAVTALAWNQNLRFGTWAVAGLGDGLLRVEDVGVAV